MSRVYTMIIDRKGEVESVAEASNANTFYVGIWSYMLKKYELAPTWSLPTLNLKTLGKLWSRVATLDYADGLAVAATFDRCWFPREEKLLRDLYDALIKVNRDSCYTETSDMRGPTIRTVAPCGTAHHVATCINHVDWRKGDRGLAFQGSLADPWACGKTGGWHRVDCNGHACEDCGKKIQNAVHMLADKECCREEAGSTYAAD